MSKEYAKSFYNSKAWKNTRQAYYESKQGLCELCGQPADEVHHKIFIKPSNIGNTDITLNWDNLQCLCRSCHSSIHERAYSINRVKQPTANGLEFDEDGNIIEKKNVFIVWGSPAAGKSTYVKEHKTKYDIVVDYNYISNALTLNTTTNIIDALPFVLDIKETLYQAIEQRKDNYNAAWIIATLPEKQKRIELARRLKGELIHINTNKEQCIKQAMADISQTDKQQQLKNINKYFERLEL